MQVPIADPVGRNHAAMLQLLLVFMGIYQPLLLLNSMWRGSGQDPLLTGAALLNTVVMWACFVLLRRGHLRFAAGLFVAASLLLAGYGYLRWGLQAQLWGQLGQLLPILVGGLVLSRREPPRLDAFDLGELLARTQPMLQQMCPAGVELELDLPVTPQLVRMDRAQLELVLLNLAANAVQAMDGSGRLRIGLQAAVPGSADVLVSDTGPGMGAEVLARCFEPFFTTKASGHGTGLGLAVAANMLEASGGKLSVDGRGPGCTMRIRVPRWVGDAAPAPTMIGSAR